MCKNTLFTRFHLLFFHFNCRTDSISLWQMDFHFLYVLIYLQFIYFVLIISQTENESSIDKKISNSTGGESVDSNLSKNISSQIKYNKTDEDEWNQFKVC